MRERSVIFWDFDGVIKESVGVKTEAYVKLFAPFGAPIAARVRRRRPPKSPGGTGEASAASISRRVTSSQ